MQVSLLVIFHDIPEGQVHKGERSLVCWQTAAVALLSWCWLSWPCPCMGVCSAAGQGAVSSYIELQLQIRAPGYTQVSYVGSPRFIRIKHELCPVRLSSYCVHIYKHSFSSSTLLLRWFDKLGIGLNGYENTELGDPNWTVIKICNGAFLPKKVRISQQCLSMSTELAGVLR